MVRDPCNLEIMHLLKYFRKATEWDGVSLCTSSQQSVSNTARQRVVFCLITVLFTPKPLHNNISERATAEGRPSPKPIFCRYNSVTNGVAGSRTKARCSATTSCRLLLRNDKMWQASNPFRGFASRTLCLKKCSYHTILVAAKQAYILCAKDKGLTNATIGGCMVFVLDLRRLFHRKFGANFQA
jgi:hypothetical protein